MRSRSASWRHSPTFRAARIAAHPKCRSSARQRKSALRRQFDGWYGHQSRDRVGPESRYGACPDRAYEPATDEAGGRMTPAPRKRTWTSVEEPPLPCTKSLMIERNRDRLANSTSSSVSIAQTRTARPSVEAGPVSTCQRLTGVGSSGSLRSVPPMVLAEISMSLALNRRIPFAGEDRAGGKLGSAARAQLRRRSHPLESVHASRAGWCALRFRLNLATLFRSQLARANAS